MGGRVRNRRLVVLCGLIIAAAVAALSYLAWRRRSYEWRLKHSIFGQIARDAGIDPKTLPRPEPFVGDISVAPDGSRVAFVPRVPGSGARDVHIGILSLHGTTDVRWISVPGSTGPGLAWSPDGRQLAFRRPGRRRSEDELVVAAADTAEERVIATVADYSLLTWPAWSPRGEWIAFVRHGGSHTLELARPDGSERRRIGYAVPYGRVRWSPDGALIYYQQRPQASPAAVRDVYASGVATPDAAPRRLTHGLDVSSLEMSPDGRYLLCKVTRLTASGPTLLGGLESLCYVASTTARSEPRLLLRSTDLAEAAFSADSRRVAFVEGGALWTVSLADGKRTKLLDDASGLAWGNACPTSGDIVFTRDTRTELWAVNETTRAPRKLYDMRAR